MSAGPHNNRRTKFYDDNDDDYYYLLAATLFWNLGMLLKWGKIKRKICKQTAQLLQRGRATVYRWNL